MISYIFIGLAALCVTITVIIYNTLTAKKLMVDNGWSDIDVQLKRRADLIPNLVEVVKGYAEHERGTLLFDTGQSPQSLTDPDFYPGGMLGWVYRRQAQFRVSDDHELTANLAALGLAPADVSHVALSHLHQDHAGNLAPVAHATVLASPAELALLGERRPELHGVLASRILPPEVTLTPASFTPSGQAGAPDDPALSAFDECADVFGDGSAVLLPTPGHSPGSMSLLLRPADARPLLLVGDVTYDPALMARGVLTDVGDRAAQRDTADRIARLAEALPGLVVLAAHDRAALAALQAS